MSCSNLVLKNYIKHKSYLTIESLPHMIPKMITILVQEKHYHQGHLLRDTTFRERERGKKKVEREYNNYIHLLKHPRVMEVWV